MTEKVKVIVAGGRDFSEYDFLETKLDMIFFMRPTPMNVEIVSGTARGVDRMGERYAKKNNLPVKRFPANWEKEGKRAGYLRNEKMAQYADMLVAFWDGTSRGTGHMIDLAHRYGLKVVVVRY